MHPRENSILGGLYGLLVGDALGVPYEFHPSTDLPPWNEIEMEPPPGFQRAHPIASPGSWSDDGAQALCLLASLLENDRLDCADVGRRLVDWFDDGYMAIDGVVFDVGIQTVTALIALKRGDPPEQAGPADPRSNGNGSLMRVLPLALWHTGSDLELASDAALQSVVTHGHARSSLCCALYCLWARYLLQNDESPWSKAVSVARQLAATQPDWSEELEVEISPESEPEGGPGGYVVTCLHTARAAMQSSSFEEAIKTAISFGGDTDTNAAVTGGVAGIRFGLENIPKRWLDKLAGRDQVDPLAEKLLARRRDAGEAS